MRRIHAQFLLSGFTYPITVAVQFRLNTLYYGDNLEILRDEKRMPSESVDLCYIDPPFNSQRNYNQIYSTPKKVDAAQLQAFTDTWTWDQAASEGLLEIENNVGGRFSTATIDLFRGLKRIIPGSSLFAYLVSMALRLTEIHRILKPTGSFYLHCDPTASHYLKLILDSIFGVENYRNEIIWLRSRNPKGSQHKNKQWGGSTDTILFYAKTSGTTLDVNSAKVPSTDEDIARRFPNMDEQGRWDDGPILCSDSMGPRPNLVYEYKGFTPGPAGWRVERSKLEEIDRAGNLYWTSSNRPRRKLRPDPNEAEPLGNCWTDIAPINSQARERMGYPTQKPEALLERIIQASSNEGDTILDAYCGCGTTVAVAQRLGRKWIGIDITYQSISLILKRIDDHFGERISKAIHVDGIPFDVDSAKALANRPDDPLRKEFEKWAILTYTNNRAVIRIKKGADKGIDGVVYFSSGGEESHRAILQAKSGGVQRKDIATLRGDMDREEAQVGFLITLEEPTKPMREEAAIAGLYHSPHLGQKIKRIQIITIRAMLEEGKRIELPLVVQVVKSAPAKKQHDLLKDSGLLPF